MVEQKKAGNVVGRPSPNWRLLAPLAAVVFFLFLLESVLWVQVIGTEELCWGAMIAFLLTYPFLAPVVRSLLLAGVELTTQRLAAGQRGDVKIVLRRLPGMVRPIARSWASLAVRLAVVSVLANLVLLTIEIFFRLFQDGQNNASAGPEMMVRKVEAGICLFGIFVASSLCLRFLLVPAFIARGHDRMQAQDLAAKSSARHRRKLLPALVLLLISPHLPMAAVWFAHSVLGLSGALGCAFFSLAGLFVLCPLLVYALLLPSRTLHNLERGRS